MTSCVTVHYFVIVPWIGSHCFLSDVDIFIGTVLFLTARRSANLPSDCELIFCVSLKTLTVGQSRVVLKQLLIVA